MKPQSNDPGAVTHYELDLFTALCGANWINATTDISQVTCRVCLSKIKELAEQLKKLEVEE